MIFKKQEETEQDIRETEEQKQLRLENEAKERDRNRALNWFSILYYLSEGDVTKMERVLKENAHLCLTVKQFEETNKPLRDYVKNKRPEYRPERYGNLG